MRRFAASLSSTPRVAIKGGRVEVSSLNAELVVDEIYRNSSVK